MSLGLWVVLCKKLLLYFPIFLLANESLRGFLDKYAKWSFAVWFLVLIGQGHRNVQEHGTHLNPKISNNCGPNTGWHSFSNIKRSVSYENVEKPYTVNIYRKVIGIV